MKKITLELVRDDWEACYRPERLASLYDRPMTVLEVLTRKDGPWANVPDADRLWTVLREGVIDDRTLRLFACDCAERVLSRAANPDPRSVEAIKVSRRFAYGDATEEELKNAAAYAAAYAANAAANAANAAYAAAYAAANVVNAAARNAERALQVAYLVRVFTLN